MTTWIADWSRFEQWLETHKVTKWKHLLSLERHDDGYRTFLARKDIAKGSTLLEIPDHLLITGNKASKWLLKNKWISHEQSKQVDSFWKPYLDVLPTSYDMLFLFRRELLVSYVTEADILPKVDHIRRILRDTFQTCIACHWSDDRDRWSSLFADFVRWYCAVVSRICFLADDIAGAMVPLGDMFNHEALDSPMETVYSKWEAGYYVFRAHRNFTIGAQVFVCYGACSNTECMLWYGFTLNENPWDSLTFYPHELDGQIILDEIVVLDRQGFSLNLLTALCSSSDNNGDVDSLLDTIHCRKLYNICLLLEAREKRVLTKLEDVGKYKRRIRLLKCWIESRIKLVRIAKNIYASS